MSNDPSRYVPLSAEDAMAKHNEELPKAFAMAEEALRQLLPNESIKINHDGAIEGFSGGVSLDPVVYERKGREMAGWQVHVLHYTCATRHQPEEIDLVEVGSPSNWIAGVQLFVETIFKEISSSYWQHLADEAHAKAWDECQAASSRKTLKEWQD